MTTYEPPPDDTLFEDDYGPGITPPPERLVPANWNPPREPVAPADPGVKATLKLALAIDRLAAALESQQTTGNSRFPASGPPAAPTGPPQGFGGPPKPRGPDPVKMGKKVYAICRAQNQDVKKMGEHILNHPVTPNSQQWSVDDLKIVLDVFTQWGWDNR